MAQEHTVTKNVISVVVTVMIVITEVLRLVSVVGIITPGGGEWRDD